MFDITWCDKYHISVLYLCFVKKNKYLSPLECVTIFEDEIVNNKAFEHANLIFTKPWALTNEIMLNIKQNLE